MTKVYLAARYSRREELCQYRTELQCAGVEVVGRWLDGEHQISDHGIPIGDNGVRIIESHDREDEEAAALRLKFATDDVEDVAAAGIVVSFTEQPRSTGNRGGRHVEFGYALATGKTLFVVGPRENLFHWLVPAANVFPRWTPEALATVIGHALREAE